MGSNAGPWEVNQQAQAHACLLVATRLSPTINLNAGSPGASPGLHCHTCTGSRCRCPNQVLCSHHCTLAASSAPACVCQSTSPPSARWHHRTGSRCHCPGPLNTAVPWPALTAASSARGSTSLLSIRRRHRTTLTCYHQITAAMNPNDSLPISYQSVLQEFWSKLTSGACSWGLLYLQEGPDVTVSK